MGGSIDLNQMSIENTIRSVMDEYQGQEDQIEITNYPGVTVSSGGSADVFGAWVEIIGDIGNIAAMLTEAVIYLADIAFPTFEMEIGIGAAASESAVSRVIGKLDIGTLSLLKTPLVNRLSRRVPANSRLSVRIKDNISSAIDYTAMIRWKNS